MAHPGAATVRRRQNRPALWWLGLLALQPSGALAGGGGDGRWWCDDVECHTSDYAYLESVVVIFLVLIAMLFEATYHLLVHIAERTYSYGKLAAVEPEELGNSHHTLIYRKKRSKHREDDRSIPLFKNYVDRFAEEFMIIGFLACLIFILREMTFFELIHRWFSFSSEVHLPRTPEEWLHAVESAHIKLFVGMVIYFALISTVVNGCVKSISEWEEMRILRRQNFAERSTAIDNTKLRNYSLWRLYFISSVIGWQEKRPTLYSETWAHLTSYGDVRHDTTFRDLLDDRFYFSAYLAYSVRACCKDTVDIHHTTWAAVLVVLVTFAILHRYGNLDLLPLMPVFIAGALILLLSLRQLVKLFRRRVERTGTRAVHCIGQCPPDTVEAEVARKSEARKSGVARRVSDHGRPRATTATGATGYTMGAVSTLYEQQLDELKEGGLGFHERHSTELWVMRVLQMFLFVICYVCARTVGDPSNWRERPQLVLGMTSGFLILFMILAVLLPTYVPLFAALMAMPPYVDTANLKDFFEVLDMSGQFAEAAARDREQSVVRLSRMAGTVQDHSDGNGLLSSPRSNTSILARVEMQQAAIAVQLRELHSILQRPSQRPGSRCETREEEGEMVSHTFTDLSDTRARSHSHHLGDVQPPPPLPRQPSHPTVASAWGAAGDISALMDEMHRLRQQVGRVERSLQGRQLAETRQASSSPDLQRTGLTPQLSW